MAPTVKLIELATRVRPEGGIVHLLFHKLVTEEEAAADPQSDDVCRRASRDPPDVT